MQSVQEYCYKKFAQSAFSPIFSPCYGLHPYNLLLYEYQGEGNMWDNM